MTAPPPPAVDTTVRRTNYALPPDVEARLCSPALVVYVDAVRRNVARVIQVAGSPDGWRPHLKTTKIPEIWAELCRAGLRHFKCATLREARVMLEVIRSEGLTDADLLVAYPLPDPARTALGELARAYPEVRVSMLCENASLVPAIAPEVSIFVDVNPGMDRTGIPLERTDAIAAVAEAAGDRFRGVHFYEGHLVDLDRAERERKAFACYDRLVALVELLESNGHLVGEAVTSGSPTFRHALAYTPFTEWTSTTHRISPGTVVYHDARSEELDPDSGLEPAALVFTRVVAHPRPGVITCDAGSKSLAAEAGDPVAVVLGHPELRAGSPSEEHLPISSPSSVPLGLGSSLHLLARHICPTVNLAESAVLAEQGRVLGAARTVARSHDLSISGGSPSNLEST